MKDLVFYSDISEMPFMRFNAFNKYVMLDSELGSTIEAFDKIVIRISEFMNKEMYEDARQEVLNMRIVYHNILTMNESKGLAFASLIKTYKGQPVDYNEESLRALLKELSDKGLTIKQVSDKISETKKKIDFELKVYFPSLFDDSQDFQSRLYRKERLLAMCDIMLGNESKVKKLFEIERELLGLFKPKNFSLQENYEVEFEKNFQILCHAMNEHTNENIKNMSVLEVYSLMEMLKKRELKNGRKSD